MSSAHAIASTSNMSNTSVCPIGRRFLNGSNVLSNRPISVQSLKGKEEENIFTGEIWECPDSDWTYWTDPKKLSPRKVVSNDHAYWTGLDGDVDGLDATVHSPAASVTHCASNVEVVR